MIDRSHVEEAALRLAGYVRRTPVLEVGRGTFGVDAALVLKLEHLQHVGVFKPRGAFNRMLSGPLPDSGVIAASGGNHGLAVAYAAARLGVRAEVFVPSTSPRFKVDRIAGLGARVQVVDGFYAEAAAAAVLRQKETGSLDVHAYDMPEVVAGQGTVGLELFEQVPRLDSVLVAVGGGGLVGGIATAIGDRVRVIGVETSGTSAWSAARAAGEPVDVEVDGLAADSLGARRMGRLGFEACVASDVGSLVVDDDDVAVARKALWREVRQITEPGGAVALAALTSGAYVPAPGENVAVVVCGANTDPADL